MSEDLTYNTYLNQMRIHPVADEVLEEYFSTRSGDRLFYRIWKGVTEKCILIGVHGMAAHGELYVQVADRMIEHGITTIALDLKHHGRSTGKKGDIEDFEELIDQLQEFVVYVGGKYPDRPIFLMGNSLGGCIVANFALRYPGQVSGVILIGPALYPYPRLSLGDSLRIPVLLLLNTLAGALPVIDVMKREVATTRNPLRTKYDASDPYRIKWISSRYLMSANFWIIRAYNHASDLATPLLILHGGKDSMFSVEDIRAFFDHVPVPDKALVVLDDAFHCLFSDPVMEESGGWETIVKWILGH